jgi:predicted adenylyl cyclase CyaB
MPVNLELKVKLNSFNPIKKTLLELNARYSGILNQTDIYYKITGGLLKLRIENGVQSIIKYKRDEKSSNRFSNYHILELSSGDARKFFKDVLEIEAVVIKKRYLYIYDNTRIHLDNVKGLGYFLELESLVINGKAEAKKRFNTICCALMLGKYNEIRKSYRDMVMSRIK